MGIDVKAFEKRLDEEVDPLEPRNVVSWTIDLIRAVIADEAAKAAPAASEPERDEPAERAEGVPEWFMEILGLCYTMGHDRRGGLALAAKGWWPIFEAEIAHRVAEDRRDALCHCQKKLKEARAERDAALAEVEKFKTTDVGTLVADAIRADRESDERECRREIRRLRAEVERLKARQIPDAWEMSGTLGDNKQRIAELEAEIERLSRPVDLGAVHKTRVDGIDYVYGYDAQQAVRLERNARESAESALAELRELVRTHYLMWTGTVAGTEWSFLKRIKSCPDADLNAALAEFRKTKEPTP